MKHYTLNDFDKNSCLKPGGMLIFTIAYVMKDSLMIIIEAMSKLKAKGGPNRLEYFDQLVQPEMIIPNILAFLIFISITKRNPKEQGHWKNLFCKGRVLLITAISLHLTILGVEQLFLINDAYMWQKGLNGPILLFMLIDILLIMFVVTSQRVKDYFLDWPSPVRAE